MKSKEWRKRCRFLFAGLAAAMVLLCTCIPCTAAGTSSLPPYYAQQMQGSGADQLPEKLPAETRRQIAGLGVDDSNFQSVGDINPKTFFSAVFGLAGTEGKGPLHAAGSCLGIILLCALVNSMKLSFGDRPLGGVADVVAALCICVGIVEPVINVLVRASSVIHTACGFGGGRTAGFRCFYAAFADNGRECGTAFVCLRVCSSDENMPCYGHCVLHFAGRKSAWTFPLFQQSS